MDVEGPREGGYDYSWDLTVEDELQDYKIEIEFNNEVIPFGTTVNMRLNNSLQDVG